MQSKVQTYYFNFIFFQYDKIFFSDEEDPLTFLANTSANEQSAYQCMKCDKSYTWRTSLLRHLREECKEVMPKYSCHRCGRRFKRAYHLRRHQRSKRPCYFMV